ncbi:MAG: glycine cleavage system protein GcvH [Clostridia bacterium]|nr:glycine cleavage system protein GcvH [Clostridia bacterium]
MKIPSDLKYTKSHEWLRECGHIIEIGLSDYAQAEMGKLVFLNLPRAGDKVTAGKAFADMESVKAVSDIYSPVTGVITEVNTPLTGAPDRINADAYGAWLIRVEATGEQSQCMDASEYKDYAEGE